MDLLKKTVQIFHHHARYFIPNWGITLLRFHFSTSLFRTFAVGTDIFVPDANTGREWFAWMMDNLPLDQLI